MESLSYLLHTLGLVLLCFAVSANDEPLDNAKYKNPKEPLEVRIKNLMSHMTLEEKIGQMVHVERANATTEVIKNHFIGMIQYLENIVETYVGLGVTRDPGLVKRIGEATALEVRATGIQYVFAPCIAVCKDPRWGRCYESYSEDHRIVQQMTEIIPGLQGDLPTGQKGVPFVSGKTKVAACARHFVGDGGTLRGINANDTVVNSNGLLDIHMPAYHDAVNKGVATVMVS